MDTKIALSALWTCLFLMGLIFLLWNFRILAVDWFRDQMFQLRDDLFDAAAAGLIDFNHPAYATLRSTMNGFIRFCHKLSVFQVLLLAVVSRSKETYQGGLFHRNWQHVTRDLDPKTLSALESYRTQMELLVITYLILSGPIVSFILFLLLLPGLAIASLREFRRKLLLEWANKLRNSQRLASLLRNIDDTAYASGASS